MKKVKMVGFQLDALGGGAKEHIITFTIKKILREVQQMDFVDLFMKHIV